MKRNVLIIGAGGVAHVAAHKCAQNMSALGDIHIASRTVSKCEAIIESVEAKASRSGEGGLTAHQVDASDPASVTNLIRSGDTQIVINVAAPFVNMAVLTACIDTGAAYIDTAIHEEPDELDLPRPWYDNYEWKRRDECADAGVTAILGAGFDPGVVNAYVRLASDGYLDTVESIDIVDVNAGDHGRYFATNFDPEINLREFSETVWSWQGGNWKPNTMFEIGREWDLPAVGKRTAYLTGHDEVHSLAANYPDADVRFWMGFNDHYISVFTMLTKLGLLSIDPVTTAEGVEVVPLKVVKAVLPDPASLAAGYTGKTCIGSLVRGQKDGKPEDVFIYNIADHAEAYREVGAQAISYTAGVPPVAAALLIANGAWDPGRMVNVEELDPKPFVDELARIGLPTSIRNSAGELRSVMP